jgi:hypothetical protein
VTDSLPTTAVPVLAARVALVLQLCCGLPLRFHVTAGVMLQGGGGSGARACPGTGSWRWIGLQTCLVSASLLCACIFTELHVVVGLTAAVCASCIIYIFPGLAYYKFINAEPRWGGTS